MTNVETAMTKEDRNRNVEQASARMPVWPGRSRWVKCCVTVACLPVLTGCSDPDVPKLVPATGTVVHNGRPLTAGSIIFHPMQGTAYDKDKPSSLLQVDGAFTMKTFPYGEGVSPGKYKVTLARELAARIRRPAYADPAKTPWELVVPETGLTNQLLEVKD
jgi:hypothetical protein